MSVSTTLTIFRRKFTTRKGITGTILSLIVLLKQRPWRIVEWGGDLDFVVQAASWFWNLLDYGLIQLGMIVIGLILIWKADSREQISAPDHLKYRLKTVEKHIGQTRKNSTTVNVWTITIILENPSHTTPINVESFALGIKATDTVLPISRRDLQQLDLDLALPGSTDAKEPIQLRPDARKELTLIFVKAPQNEIVLTFNDSKGKHHAIDIGSS